MLGLGGSISVIEIIFSITMALYPLIIPASSTCCGAARYLVEELAKFPVAKLATASDTVNGALVLTVVPKVGNVKRAVGYKGIIKSINFVLNDLTLRVRAGMIPIGAALQDPALTCRPPVLVRFVSKAQKLMKLLVEVREGDCPCVVEKTRLLKGIITDDFENAPVVGTDWPLLANADAMIDGFRVNEF